MSVPTPVQVSSTESYWAKFVRRFKEEPLVPIGCFGTCAALIMATTKMRKGEAKSFNRWLRIRIIAQGLTIAAVVAGSYAFGRTQELQAKKAEHDQQRLLEKAAKERAEFEQRMKEAEDAHEREQGAMSFSWGRKGQGESQTPKALDGDANKVSKVARVEEAVKEKEKEVSGSGSGWWGWVGYGSIWGSSSQEGKKEEKKSP